MSSTDRPVISDKPKKRNKNFTHKKRLKFQRISSHERGEDCKCKMKCFEAITDKEKDGLLNQFNSISSKDARDSHLAFFVQVKNLFSTHLE